MKRSILFLFFLTSAIISHAQITIDLGQIQSAQNVDLKCLIQDAKTGDALPYTTVYLIPQGDTTITHFALSDEKGAVKIEGIVPGKYVFNAELIGYKPFKKVYDFYGYGLWAIVLKESQEVIGIVGFTPRDSQKDVPDIELGYAINKQYRNKGYGYEAAKAAIEYAEKNIEYGQILICVDKNNIPGKNLGNKIKVLTSDVFFCSID